VCNIKPFHQVIYICTCIFAEAATSHFSVNIRRSSTLAALDGVVLLQESFLEMEFWWNCTIPQQVELCPAKPEQTLNSLDVERQSSGIKRLGKLK